MAQNVVRKLIAAMPYNSIWDDKDFQSFRHPAAVIGLPVEENDALQSLL